MLAGFERISLGAGQSRVVNFYVSAIELAVADKSGKRVSPRGTWTARVGESRMQFEL